MSTPLIPVTIVIATALTDLPSTSAPFASVSVLVTDSSGIPQTPVLLTGGETPPFSFVTSVAPGDGSVVATALDTAGATLGTPVTQAFTEAGTPPVTTQFPAPVSISVTPVTPAA